jgi:Lamin Tail Domain
MRKKSTALVLALAMMLFAAPAQAQLYINEFMAQNTSTIMDPQGAFEDWLEIYNAGNAPVNLGGYHLSDNPAIRSKYQIPSGSPLTTVPAGGWLLFWCDEDGIDGPLHTNFKLSAGGEFVGLYTADSVVIDTVTFGAQSPNVSLGRATDGGSPWVLFTTSTPGASNAPVGVALSSTSRVLAYPNPARDHVQVTGGGTWTIFSLSGQAVGTTDAEGRAAIGHLAPGIYALRSEAGLSIRVLKR